LQSLSSILDFAATALSDPAMTLENTLVSVVIPVYNGQAFVGRTLNSALAQSYQPIEIVIVDDGSTDETPNIIEAVVAANTNIRFFRRQNHGVAATRNFGISQANGKLIAPLDADDLWHPQKIARQVEMMQASSPVVGLVYCWSVEIDESDLIIPPLTGLRERSTAQGRVTEELSKGCFIESGSSPLIRRSLIDSVGGYDANLRPQGADDWKLYLALSEVCEFAVIPEYLVGYRQAAGSVSRNLKAMGQSMKNVARWMFERRPDLPDALRRQAMYGVDLFMAQRALDSDRFGTALGYQLAAYKSQPLGVFDRPTFDFAVRFFARILGFKRSDLRRRGVRPQVTFDEFQAMQRNTTISR
jgi:glycosyltransferase involved in cell wall biosynthesis